MSKSGKRTTAWVPLPFTTTTSQPVEQEAQPAEATTATTTTTRTISIPFGIETTYLDIRHVPLALLTQDDVTWLSKRPSAQTPFGCNVKVSSVYPYLPTLLTLATRAKALCIDLTDLKSGNDSNRPWRTLLTSLMSRDFFKGGTNTHIPALLLHRQLGIVIERLYDLSHVYTFGRGTSSFPDLSSYTTFDILLGLFPDFTDPKLDANAEYTHITPAETKLAALEAWASGMIMLRNKEKVEEKGACVMLNSDAKQWVADMCVDVTQSWGLVRGGRRTVENEFQSYYFTRDGNLVVFSSRFVTRIRRTHNARIIMDDGFEFTAVPLRAHGKTCVLGKLSAHPAKVHRIKIDKIILEEAQEHSSDSEQWMSQWLSECLVGNWQPTSWYMSMLFEPGTCSELALRSATDDDIAKLPSSCAAHFDGLYPAQRDVVFDIVYGENGVSLVQGPPGTGKTKCIAKAVQVWCEQQKDQDATQSRAVDIPTFVITAKSNIAVKTIATALLKHGFDDFHVFVSSEFYYEWHEHIYTDFQSHISTSDDMAPSKVAELLARFKKARVVLCTLAMITTPKVTSFLQSAKRSVTTVVVDEASQTYIGDYIPMLSMYPSIEHLAFLGDPCQLPPFGNNAQQQPIRQIFDLPQLQPITHFLNLQYRMPAPVASFLSDKVYSNRLLTAEVDSSNVCEHPLVWWDVLGAESEFGNSFVNHREAGLIVDLICSYRQPSGVFSNRHAGTTLTASASTFSQSPNSVAVLTPYDAQRSHISGLLASKKEKRLAKRVFNIDTFQGQECDVVFISLVRTDVAGFVKDWRRINVALSRAKVQCVIFGRHTFWRKQPNLLGDVAAFCDTSKSVVQ